MTPARFQTIEEIFLGALDQVPEKIGQFLDTACKGDEVLRREVEALLASDQRAGRFIETSTVGLATKIIENEQAHSLLGKRIGHYKISDSIGIGGMGEVYLAADVVAGRKAALKLLPMRFTGDTERLKRFQQEAHTVVGLNHPNILTVYEIGEDHAIHYIASELIEGETLRQRLTRGRVELSEAVDVAIQVASALAAAHNAGIVHRDIKPENIMLRPDGYAKVLDFGIAKLAEQELPTSIPKDEALLLVETNLGSVLGTVRYMSPEQARGGYVDKTTDIWSLGAVLYEMLTGHPPFSGETPKEVMSAILEKEPPPLTRSVTRAPAELRQIVSKTLRKDPAQRYHDAHELLQALKELRRKLEAELERAAAPLWLRWARSPAALVLVLTIAVLALALPFYRHRNLATSLPLDKSIAVLPFENLSDEREHAAFADGVQDDILTKLAKIADLKVISRTSVMDYRGKRNLRQIGNDLGVSHFLEGSVRRAGTHLRLNAQLIDTRTDTHVWAQQYDRDLNDLFAIQNEIAQKVAEQLNAKVTSAERLAIEEKPTTDLTAFELYSRANDLLAVNSQMPDTLKAIDMLNQAVARDPSFFKAYCLLVVAHDGLYAFFDHAPARLALAEAAVREAFRIRPNAGEAHWARAFHLYNGYRDYDGALAELELARRSLPNDPYVFKLMGSIQRRQGRWEESTRNFERAIELDPRDTRILIQTGGSYGIFRRYAEQKSKLDRALTIAPNDVGIKADHAFVEVDWKADTGPLHRLIDEIRATDPAAVPKIAGRWLLCALAERDVTSAKDAFLAAEFPLGDESVQFPRPFVEGVIARMAKDEPKAQLAFTAAREKQEKTVNAQPDYAPGWCALGVIDAALGRKEQALSEGRRAVELLPVEKDSINGLVMIKYLALSAAWVGDKDLACEQLATAVRRPSDLSYGELKLMPWWDPLRGDPRFEKIVEDSKQPIALELVEKNAPEKSIAVLPFESLSEEKADASFTDGIQDEILTRLSKIADLKVISRTSTQHYKSAPENLPEIARQLNVAHILEGRVQKSGDAVRVNVQLIKAANDSHLWADTFDRKLTDIFSVESDVAKAIADQLRAKLTGEEEQAIAAKPTDNPEAYHAYLRGLAYTLKAANTAAEVLAAQKYLREAVRLDPKFALSWALLSYVDADAVLNFQPSAAIREEARQASETALTLQPNLGEAVLAKGFYHYACLKDYDTAVRYFEQARQFLPNSSRIPASLAYVARRRGQWGRSESYFNEAERLDPRNVSLLTSHAETYKLLRRFPEALRKLDQVLDITPDDLVITAYKAAIAQAEGDLPQASALLAPLQPGADDIEVLELQIYQAILERRPAPIIPRLKERLLAAKPDPALGFLNAELRFWLGWAQDVTGDHAAARETWRQARSELESILKEQPENFGLMGDLALTNMGLGDKAAALALSERAIATNPIQKDLLDGPGSIEILARVTAGMGEPDRAIAALQKLVSIPYDGALVFSMPLTPALLRLDPMFDLLRSDPRFQKLSEDKQP